jgi:hypothetical protein
VTTLLTITGTFSRSVDHVVTADMDDGQPLRHSQTASSGASCDSGIATLWRRITPHPNSLLP